MQGALFYHSPFGIAYGVLYYKGTRVYLFNFKQHFGNLQTGHYAKKDFSVWVGVSFFSKTAITPKNGNATT